MTDGATPMTQVRFAVEGDVPALLDLMRGLAKFEGYADKFAVTEEVLIEQGFRRSPPDFECLVTDGPDGKPVAMLVFYMIPFAFRAKPTLFVKELYVVEARRGNGDGDRLMRAAAAEAVKRGCALMKWQVAGWNAEAARFYKRLGAVADTEWVDYSVSGDALTNLGRETL